MLRRSFTHFAVVLTSLTAALPSLAVEPKSDPKPDEIKEIIKKFTEKETEFSRARENYVYRQTNKIIELDDGGQPGGQYEMVEEVTFDDRNRRTEHVLRAPVATLRNILMTPEDEQDMRNVMPFVMTTDTLDQYDVTYVKREPVDEISCYVFTVKPKTLTKDRKRYFEGDIWVDDQDLQIVKTYGRSTGHLRKNEDQQFPRFETYRQQIDGKYWFPVYTYADDTLNFASNAQRIKVVIKYDQYKKYQFKSESTITFGAPGTSGENNGGNQSNNGSKSTAPPPAPK